MTPPAGHYLALFTALPTDGGGYAGEVNAPSYHRIGVIFTAPAGTPAKIQLTNDVEFDVAQEPWGNIKAVAVMDAEPSGTGAMLAWAPLDTARDVNANDMFLFAAADLTISLD